MPETIPPSSPVSASRSAYGLVLVGALAISVRSVLVKLAYRYGVTPAELLALRLAIVLPLVGLTVLVRQGLRGFRLSGRQVVTLAFSGTLGLGAAMATSFFAIEHIDAGLATLVTFSYPALTVLATVVLGHDRPPRRVFVALALTSAGLCLVVPIAEIAASRETAIGVMLALTSAVAFAYYTIQTERLVRTLTPATVLFFALGAALGAVLTVFDVEPRTVSSEVWWIALALGGVAGYVPFLTSTIGVQRLGAARTTILTSLSPALTVLWASLFLGEHLGPLQIAGMVLVIAGVLALELELPFVLVVGRREEVLDRIRDHGDPDAAPRVVAVLGRVR